MTSARKKLNGVTFYANPIRKSVAVREDPFKKA
jgi:hypothetical protein